MSFSVTAIVFLSVMMLGVWVLSGIVVLSYTRYQSAVKYIHSIVVFPLVTAGVWCGVYLSAGFVRAILSEGASRGVFITVVVVTVIVLVPLLLSVLIYLWLRLVSFLDTQYSRY